MTRSGSRNTERTRTAVLTATEHLILTKGLAFSLGEVASAAGVSKSGLLHHFSSKDDLVLETTQRICQSLREVVLRQVDLAENTPGKLLRAYVRTLCGGDEQAARGCALFMMLKASVEAAPQIEGVLAEDSAWWTKNLAADGMDPDLLHLVLRATEGCAIAYVWGAETAEEARHLRDILLKMCP
ncbi:TetR/AcrR family transcriptional regulator [Schaalia sp. ZJ405]|uniref:TetR/AcrR family transcriptional regulator n=1 Tax=unclassified Schaalia TaxID=2691889 RepID=UPI0013EA14BA|nr:MULTISPECIES: TetR/AcrR family transcriptional regulator [unclassified Schaalia]QPK81377.1 TetR/AcrR family transcriptional regulator [Schaalia sp. ZJ405]